VNGGKNENKSESKSKSEPLQLLPSAKLLTRRRNPRRATSAPSACVGWFCSS
jgi:hypothetical protein